MKNYPKCQYCGQEFSTKGYCLAHENRCDKNPAWIEEKKRRKAEIDKVLKR